MRGFDPLQADEVIFRLVIEPEMEPVRGNAMASGDEALDREVENEILEREEREALDALNMAIVDAVLDADRVRLYLTHRPSAVGWPNAPDVGGGGT